MLIVDTNVWLAAADRRSKRHHDCVTLLSEHREQLVSPVPEVAETSWLILDRLGTTAHQQFLSLIPPGQVEALDLTPADWIRSIELCDRYRDLRLDLMDAVAGM